MFTTASRTVICVRTFLGGCLMVTFCALATAEPTAFANYSRFVPISPTEVQAFYEEGPFPDFGVPVLTDGPLPGWNENAVWTRVAAPDLPPPSINMDTLIATLRADGRATQIARDDEENELGRLVMDQTGEDKVDLNAANAIVNETEGTIRVQLDGSLLDDQPAVAFSLLEATGIYDSDVTIMDIGVGYAGGYFVLPLDDDPSTSLQENILNAFQAGEFIGSEVVGVWSGAYIPEPSTLLLTLVTLGVIGGCRMWKRSA